MLLCKHGSRGGGVSGSAGRSHQALFTGHRGRWACLFTVFPEGKSSLSQGKRGNLVVISDPANRKLWPNVGSMLGQRRRRWLNIEPTLGQCLIFVGKWRDGKLGQCWPNVKSAGPSSNQAFYLMWAALASIISTSKHDTLIQCWLTLGQRRRRWTSFSLALYQRVVFAGRASSISISDYLVDVGDTLFWYVGIHIFKFVVVQLLWKQYGGHVHKQ